MDIIARTIPHEQQRYPTTGDWELQPAGCTIHTRPAALHVRVSKMPDERYEQLVAVHEIIEALLCKQAGVSEESVSEFDELYEAKRDSLTQHANTAIAASTALKKAFGCTCLITNDSEPGDDIHAPYYRQHQIATGIERILAAELGVDWNAYEAANLALYDDAK
jgi:hypothetical protein